MSGVPGSRFTLYRVAVPVVSRLLVLIVLLASSMPAQQETSIDSIKNGEIAVGDRATIQGRFSGQRVLSLAATGYYLKGVTGSSIQIRTSQSLPSITSELRITGVVGRDEQSGEYFLSETRRVVTRQAEVSAAKPSRKIEKTAEEPPARRLEPARATARKQSAEPATAPSSRTSLPSLKDLAALTRLQGHEEQVQLALKIAAGLVGCLLLLSIFRRFRRKQPEGQQSQPPAYAARTFENPIPPPRRVSPRGPESGRMSAVASAIARAASRTPAPARCSSPPEPAEERPRQSMASLTRKLLPARLVVLRNQEETDIIDLTEQLGAGEIEIGRESPDVNGGIRLRDPSHTLSRHQARLIYNAATGEFKLLNLAGESGNPTTINGRKLAQNEATVLQAEDIVGMGSIKLKFKKL